MIHATSRTRSRGSRPWKCQGRMSLLPRFEAMSTERGNRYLVDSLAAKARPECGVNP